MPPLVRSIRFSTLAFQLGAPRRSSSCSSLFPAKRGSCRTWNGGARNARGNCFGRLRKLCIVSIGSVSSGSDPFTLRSSSETEGPALTVVHALRRMWELIADDRMVVYIAFVSLTVAAISEILIPTILTASVFSAQRGNTVAFYGYGRLLIILCFISGICSGMRSGCFALANVTLVKHLRERLYSTLIFQDISFFDIEPVGGLTSRLGADCQRMSQVLANDLHLILRNILQGTGALVNLLILSWPLTLSTLLICSILAAIFLVYGRYQKNAAKVSQDLTAVANQIAEDTLSQMRTVRVYGSEKVEIKRYRQWIERLASVGILESVAYGSWSMSFTMLYRLTQVLAVMLGGISLLTGHVSSEQLTKYVLYCEWMIYATWRLVDSLSSLMQSIGASERVFQLMNLSTRDQYLTKEYMQLHEGIKLPNLTGCIEFKDVSFCYPCRTMVPVLQDVNLLVQPGNVVAIVGPSGCGKSSLINLLLRLYEPSHGLLYIDNIPVEKLDVRWLRSKIGYVGQGPYLFHMDIKSNISYGCSRNITQKGIQQAAKEAGAHEFISSLPNGYEAIVHEGLLSDGQKQRIAIARATLRDPDILILDEATSALDMESEHQIKALIQGLRNDTRPRTIITVAHRLTTVERADNIIVMNNGKVVEVGTHSELIHRNGVYARLFKLQTDWLR